MSYLILTKVAAVLQQHLTNLRLGKYSNATIFLREKEEKERQKERERGCAGTTLKSSQ